MTLALLILPLTTLLACGDKDDGGTDGTADGGTTVSDGGTTGTTGGIDADGDGYDADEDCDDSDDSVHPGATEICNDGVDDDCDDKVDDADDSLDLSTAGTWYPDDDGDGYGDDSAAITACDQPDNTIATGGDCNDADDAYNPGAAEDDCSDPNDYNCDGSVGYDDADGDGFAACEDCDDRRGDINPDATEVCDLYDTDEDCDGLVDDDDDSVDLSGATAWYPDDDIDGFGDERSTRTLACDQPAGMVADFSDCDDSRADVNPLGSEVCDELDTDEDCDGVAEDEDGSVDTSTRSLWYADTDTDGYGDIDDAGTRSCNGGLMLVADHTDCDDSRDDVNPGATEVCDDLDTDEDCDGLVDDDDASTDSSSMSTWYVDGDLDGFGDVEDLGILACSAPGSLVADHTDCDDSRDDVNPSAPEICDPADIDEDCDGVSDDDDATTVGATMSVWYADSDADGFGDLTAARTACDLPDGYVTNPADCDDDRADVHPDATEICDDADVDEDCDDLADDADDSVDHSTFSTFYQDADDDGYGISDVTRDACDEPAGMAAVDGDCDDDDRAINPGVSEVDDLIDNDCDELCDEDFIDVGDLVITEFMPNPQAVSDADGEWLEITNVSDRDVRFCGGWVIGDDDTNEHVIVGDLTLAAGGILVMGHNSDTATNGGAPVDYAYGTDVGLANGDDEIVLTFDGEIIDHVAYDMAGDWADIYHSGTSLTLASGRLSAVSNDDASSWCAAVSTYGDGDLGTPGASNDGECADYCTDTSYTLYAEADTNVNYGVGAISPSPDIVAYTNTDDDVVGWVRFDVSGIPSSALVTAATLWLHGDDSSAVPFGSPTIDIVHSDDDDWTDAAVTDSGDLARGDRVSASTVSSFTATDYNEFTLDVDAWDWSSDLSDGLMTLGADEVSGGTYAYMFFYGTTAAYQATLDVEVCE